MPKLKLLIFLLVAILINGQASFAGQLVGSGGTTADNTSRKYIDQSCYTVVSSTMFADLMKPGYFIIYNGGSYKISQVVVEKDKELVTITMNLINSSTPVTLKVSRTTQLRLADEEGKAVAGFTAKSMHPISARVVECVEGTFLGLFLTPNPGTGETFFQVLENTMSGFVLVVLLLYIVVNGYQVAMGKGIADGENGKKEMVLMVGKVILVFYFAVGDAWKDYFLIALRSISTTGGLIMLRAGLANVSDGCYFNPGLYPYGKEHIIMFDTLDCKVANYMGWFRGEPFPAIGQIGFSFLLLGGPIGTVLFVLSVGLVMQLLAMVMEVACMYLMSMIQLSVLLFLTPIIAPAVLFDQTEEMYKTWVEKMVSVTMAPIILMAIMGIFIPITDKLFYGEDPEAGKLFLKVANYSNSSSIDGDFLGIPGTDSDQSNGTWINTSGQGADVNPACYGGYFEGTEWLTPWRVGLVCIVKWMGVAAKIPFPIPGWLVFFNIYIPSRWDLMIPFLVTEFLYLILMTFILLIKEKLYMFIEQLTSTSLDSNAAPRAATAGKNASQEALKYAQDKKAADKKLDLDKMKVSVDIKTGTETNKGGFVENPSAGGEAGGAGGAPAAPSVNVQSAAGGS